jgi:hypothetical protein
MSAMNLFARLRKRQRAVAVAMLPLLVTVWVSAAASACPRMAVDSHDHAATATVPAEHHAADHDHAQAPHGLHGHSANGVSNASTEPERSHRACPHCPASTDGSFPDSSATHVVCALLDDVADAGAQASVYPSQLEQLAPAAQPIYVSPLELRSFILRSRSTAAPIYRSVALNLRHCVFLI